VKSIRSQVVDNSRCRALSTQGSDWDSEP